jgi:hypothetical protein
MEKAQVSDALVCGDRFGYSLHADDGAMAKRGRRSINDKKQSCLAEYQ